MIKQKSAVDKEVKSFLANNIDSSMTDVQKELAIHDYLAKTAEYNVKDKDKNLAPDHNAYGVLVLKTGVCESYAKAFQLLANEAGLESKYVTGDASNGPGHTERHAWNMVKLDGEWYNVDVTWDDPTYSKPEDKWIEVRYNYFNVPDSIMNKTHTRDEKLVSYPKANGTKYSYENLGIQQKDKDGNSFEDVKSIAELHQEIKQAIEDKRTTLFVKTYNLGMEQKELLAQIKIVKANNSGMNTNGLSSFGILSSGDSIKLVKYSFEY